MYKILKLSSFYFIRAKILVIIMVLALNIPAHSVSAAWGFEGIIATISGKNSDYFSDFVITGDSIMVVNMPKVPHTIRTTLTAYSSTPDQTDDTPFITASNTYVRDGVVAANFLAFGTKVQIPEIFGDKIFTVEDRMAKKHNDKIDIWFPERYLAKKFGVQEAEVIVLQ
ncbi:hypothetical protein A2819_01750 [Candidatus Azambacteria bacterium RIFCSPHIGHO2_01_FULL_40_24]|uniref:3D domain-containing protein n=1 Tax=Candidatus Azambacteria bacterium RIFCSPHIGHO2_01_FULL_40_24 TaxID=1797301 RepID=A0A1F5B383_9BACT|nr:MAG: hypothetical protein A2819_01750 [Candidatus Azambacteria bacterium RIFCSPHIGHO2_01_FULL_40_24]